MSTTEDAKAPGTSTEPVKEPINLKDEKEKLAKHDEPESKTFSRRQPLKFLEKKNTNLFFGRNDPRKTIVLRTVNIEQQNTLSGLTYDTMRTLLREDLSITRANFITLWKTVLLKRVQDIYEFEYKLRPQHYVRLNRSLELPAPLADLLSALGQYTSVAKGYKFNLSSPAQPVDQIPAWWATNANIIAAWDATMAQLNGQYQLKEYPSFINCTDGAIQLCATRRANNFVEVKAYTNEPRLTDGYLAAVNDDLFEENPILTFDNCHLIMTERLQNTTIRRQYVRGYIVNK